VLEANSDEGGSAGSGETLALAKPSAGNPCGPGQGQSALAMGQLTLQMA